MFGIRTYDSINKVEIINTRRNDISPLFALLRRVKLLTGPLRVRLRPAADEK